MVGASSGLSLRQKAAVVVRMMLSEGADLDLSQLPAELQALLAQEEAPGLSERLERFLAEITRVGDQVERAAEAMETEQQGRALMQQMAGILAAQQRQIGEIQRGMAQILALLGEPLEQ